jgi:ABC-type glycerol-3-phosphate transport system substrate-binding protein
LSVPHISGYTGGGTWKYPPYRVPKVIVTPRADLANSVVAIAIRHEEKKMQHKNLSRRAFMRGAAGLAGVLLAACAPQVIKETVVVEKPVEKVVKETVVVEKKVEVQKEVTKIVEKQVEAVKPPVTIRVHYQGDPAWAWIKTRSPIFESRYPNIKVQHEAVPAAEYFAKVRTMFAGGQLGDVLWTWHENGAFQEFWKKGLYSPMNDMVEAQKFDLTGFYKISLDVMTREGKLFMLPEYIHPGPTGYHFNKDRCDEVGIKYVPETPADKADIHDDWTLDDFFRVAAKLQKAEGDKVSMWGFTRDFVHHQVVSMLRCFGGDVQMPDGKKAAIDSPESIQGLKWAWSMIWDKKFHPNPGAMEQGARDMFVAGRSAMYCHGVATVLALPALVKDKFRFGSVLMPKHPTTGKRGFILSTGGFGITTQSKSRLEAWEWIKANTDFETGVAKVAMNSGGPGAFPAVWTDPRVTSFSRIMAPFGTIIDQAVPNVDPWNGRAAEIVAAVNNETTAIWLNKLTPEEGAKKCAAAVNEILAKQPG